MIGVLSLLIALVIVGTLAKKQLHARRAAAGAASAEDDRVAIDGGA